jgi:hypothetical protein
MGSSIRNSGGGSIPAGVNSTSNMDYAAEVQRARNSSGGGGLPAGVSTSSNMDYAQARPASMEYDYSRYGQSRDGDAGRRDGDLGRRDGDPGRRDGDAGRRDDWGEKDDKEFEVKLERCRQQIRNLTQENKELFTRVLIKGNDGAPQASGEQPTMPVSREQRPALSAGSSAMPSLASRIPALSSGNADSSTVPSNNGRSQGVPSATQNQNSVSPVPVLEKKASLSPPPGASIQEMLQQAREWAAVEVQRKLNEASLTKSSNDRK